MTHLILLLLVLWKKAQGIQVHAGDRGAGTWSSQCGKYRTGPEDRIQDRTGRQVTSEYRTGQEDRFTREYRTGQEDRLPVNTGQGRKTGLPENTGQGRKTG